MDITYEYYKIFYYVAKYKSFSKAAAVMTRGQPNITKMINNLERQIGCKLFVRSNRGVTLTDEGEKLYTHVEIAVSHLITAEDEITNEHSMSKGTIRIATTEVALYGCVLPALASFSVDYPDVKIKLTNQTNNNALHSLENGTVDFAVVTTKDIDKEKFRFNRICEFREILCCKKGYKGNTGEKGLDAINNSPYISLDSATHTYMFLREYLFKKGVYKEPDISVATVDQVLPIVKSGVGIGFIAEFVAKEALESGDICEIVLDDPPPARTVCFVFDKKRSVSTVAKKFTEYLQSTENVKLL